MNVVAWVLALTLHIGLVFAPLVGWCFSLGASAPAFATLACGLTLLLLADATGRPDGGSPSSQALDLQAHRLARRTGIALLLLVWTAVAECRCDPASVPLAQIACGAGVMLLGIVCRAAAVRRLGARFVTDVTPAGPQQLEQTGIYRLARHPSETGLLLAALGIVILLDAPLTGAIGWPLLALLSYQRVRLEEIALRDTFGRAYAEYSTRVGPFVPVPFAGWCEICGRGAPVADLERP